MPTSISAQEGASSPFAVGTRQLLGYFHPGFCAASRGGGAAPSWRIYLHSGISAGDTGSEDGAEPVLAATHHLKHLVFPRHLKKGGGLVEVSKHVEKTWVLI